MYPFWDLVIGPIIGATPGRRVVEIGALRGETTQHMVDQLGSSVEIHVIDPVPDFDPAEHEAKFGGQYIFHRDLSHNVLPHLPAMDVALIDGDHNWYTVYHELKMLADTAAAADAPLPVMVMHDVGWPYGRRDLYYDPDQIPAEFRQDYDQRGMRPGRKRLLPGGSGMNSTMHNALIEGGPRNGVMTALEDFIAEHERPVRQLVIPIYFGLAIVVEEQRLAETPELAAVLDKLETADGRGELLNLSEDTRLASMVFQHSQLAKRTRENSKLIDRYLDMLKASLLDEHYRENEVRLKYLASCNDRGTTPQVQSLWQPKLAQPDAVRKVELAQRNGPQQEGVGAPFAYADMGRVHLDELEACLDDIQAEGVPGDLVECGTHRGGGGIFLRGWLEAHDIPDRVVWVADEFRAAPAGGVPESTGLLDPNGLMPDLGMVRAAFERFGLLDDRVKFLQGPCVDTLTNAGIGTISLVRIGSGASQNAGEILDALYDRLSVGGAVFIEDHGDEECRNAVEKFRAERGITDQIERIGWSGLRWAKRAEAASTNGQHPLSEGRHPPLATPLPTEHADLSVIVVFYNMKREAVRTLHSLTRAYQEGIEDLDYEVIVIDNGSSPDQLLGADFVRAFGPRFRYLDMGEEASSSPVHALNRGLTMARGESIAFMIDGAHVLTPGVFQFAMQSLATYKPAIVAVQQWYVGPGQQPDALASGYDLDYEDRLFDQITWPMDGYRLFDIGHFIGERDWFDGMGESNCIFAPRSVLEQVGGLDGSFSMPGGGFANLELYERLGTNPDVTVTTLLGEASFHQAHGGTTTNQVDPAERHRRIASYGQHYRELRGRPFRGIKKPIHYLGHLSRSSIRTKPRRLVAPDFRQATWGDTDGKAETSVPIPAELADEYTSAYWHSLGWQETTWLGWPVGKVANDLMAYQELITQVRPDWVVETGTGNGGRALFLASICELLGTGEVISIGETPPDDLPSHPRITFLRSNTVKDKTGTRVRDQVQDGRALVVLGSRSVPPKTRKEFELYAPLVPTGSYVVVEDTVVHGHPVWPGFGPGPAEGVKLILRTQEPVWAQDPTLERFGLTFNPGGFLRRL